MKKRSKKNVTKASPKTAAAKIITAPKPEALNIHADRDGQEFGWTAREGKEIHYTSPACCHSSSEAEEVGAAWLGLYRKADEAGRIKMLGWKPAARAAKPSKAEAKAAKKHDAELKKGVAKNIAIAEAKHAAAIREDKPAAEKKKRVSLLDAAAAVLKKAATAMNVKDIIAAVSEAKLWAPMHAGKTPHATLAAAIAREITAKGDDARFYKADRGLFAAKA